MSPNYSPIVLCNPPLFKTLTMSTPDEWRAQGRTWDSILQSMKKIAEQILEVPENHASELLPSPHISINAMLKFPLPNSMLSLPTSNMQLYFSHKRPDFLNDTLVLSLKHLPIPAAVCRCTAGMAGWVQFGRIYSSCRDNSDPLSAMGHYPMELNS